MTEPDTIDTAAGPLTIQPVRHASFALLLNDLTIFVDPADNASGFAGLPTPNVILFTHEHGDHFVVDDLEQLADTGTIIYAPAHVARQIPHHLAEQVREVAPGDRTSFGEVGIEVLPAHNLTPERLKYHPASLGGVGYVLTLGGRRIYISGDTEDIAEMRALTGIDVAFLPMNLPYTMTGSQAADAAMAFRPAILYPFHYMGGVENEICAGLLRQSEHTEVRLRDWYPAS